jgi:hypothetical protein
MPHRVRKSGSKWAVVDKRTGDQPRRRARLTVDVEFLAVDTELTQKPLRDRYGRYCRHDPNGG